MSELKSFDDFLGSTAYWTASVRALESKRVESLFTDPWAAGLAGQKGTDWLEQRSAESVLPIVIRTRYFDDYLQRISEEVGIRQIVLLGAGLDTRAFRLGWPANTRIYELDQPVVLDYKEHFLQASGGQPQCDRRVVGVDLMVSWKDALLENGYDPQERSGWLVEGLLFYLPGEKIVQILEDVSSVAAPGSWMGFDIINQAMLASPITQKWIEMQAAAGAPWIGTLDNPVEFLEKRGWQAKVTQAGAADANYGRWSLPVIPTMMPEMPHNWYVTALKIA